MFWHTIGLLFLGALIGWLASKIMHGKGGLIRNIIVGIAGSVLGGWLADWIGLAPATSGRSAVSSSPSAARAC
ncbi:hypothetical protein SDC9_55879 [bioreactor metagenome]|uniref:GlsB/YeaQ/YmgE family stress response membrane protein n=1 Tax=bioreactor metagenome TaxID=1076179 RepID=A0A644X189_9ZZZZ